MHTLNDYAENKLKTCMHMFRQQEVGVVTTHGQHEGGSAVLPAVLSATPP